MKINYIKTMGFRKFKEEFETELYDITNITGKNRSGKSNVLFAIINIMLGTNLSGDDKVSLINRHSDASYGEMKFTDNNGKEHTIIRAKSKYPGKDNYLALDGKPAVQSDLVRFYNEKKLFLSIMNPLYFLSKKPAEQKELVDKYLPNISTEVVYENLSKSEKAILEGIPQDIPRYITETNDEIKRLDAIIATIDGKIEYAKNITETVLDSRKIFDKDEELSLARQELSFLSTNKDVPEKDKQKQVVENLEKDILSKETEIAELETSMKNGKAKYLAIKDGLSCLCPTCNQHIENESKNRAINNMRTELMGYYDRKNALETSLKDLKFKHMQERCKYHAIETGSSIAENNKRIETVQDNIIKLEAEKLEIEKFNSEISVKEKSIQSAKEDILKFKNEKQTYEKTINNLNKAKKVAQKLYISYIEEKMKYAKQYLKDVDIKFYSVLKTTGEIKEDFVITYKGNVLADLSRSETIATALEFANMFNKISGCNFPIFIDDYESCADYDFIKDYAEDTQIIISKVEKGNMLKIANANGDKFTVIRPVIKGCRTIKIQNTSKLPKVA